MYYPPPPPSFVVHYIHLCNVCLSSLHTLNTEYALRDNAADDDDDGDTDVVNDGSV